MIRCPLKTPHPMYYIYIKWLRGDINVDTMMEKYDAAYLTQRISGIHGSSDQIVFSTQEGYVQCLLEWS